MKNEKKEIISKNFESFYTIEDSFGGSPSPEKQQTSQMQSQINILFQTYDTWSKQMKDLTSQIQNQKKSIHQAKIDFEDLKNETKKAELRSIEVIGIISAIIALVLVFISSSKEMVSVKQTFMILITGTSSLILFAALMHFFFDPNGKRNWVYYLCFITLPIVVIALIGFSVLNS